MNQNKIVRQTFSKSTSPESIRQLFKTAGDEPKQLVIQGRPESLSHLEKIPMKALGIVGTRNPMAKSLRFIEKLLNALKNTPLVVVSGFAVGIDRKVHEMCVELEIPTVGVLATHLDNPYPRKNILLRQKLLESGGLLITEKTRNGPVYKSDFLARNRLIASWSNAVVVVEAAKRSGALNTAKWAFDQFHDCYAVPSFPGEQAYAGNQKLLSIPMAHPIWDVTSLGTTWPHLSTIDLATAKQMRGKTRDEEVILSVMRDLDENDSILLSELFDRTHSNGIIPDQFHLSLKNLEKRNVLTIKNAIVKLAVRPISYEF